MGPLVSPMERSAPDPTPEMHTDSDPPRQAGDPLKCMLTYPLAQASQASDTSSVVNLRRRQHLQSALVEKLLNKYYPGSFVALTFYKGVSAASKLPSTV